MLHKFGNIDEHLNSAIIENIIVPNSRLETIRTFYHPETPSEVVQFFRFLVDNISLQSNGMGVELRESKYNISSLLKEEGFEYKMLSHLVDDFENKLLTQYYDNVEKDKSE